ncbi:MAG: hypothetical protein ACJ79V_17965 [Myxococcales bacterium]
MAQTVQFPPDAGAIDDAVRRDIVRVLERIADSVSCIPPEDAFWESMGVSLLQVDVSGFRVGYRLERDAVRIIELQQIPR